MLNSFVLKEPFEVTLKPLGLNPSLDKNFRFNGAKSKAEDQLKISSQNHFYQSLEKYSTEGLLDVLRKMNFFKTNKGFMSKR